MYFFFFNKLCYVQPPCLTHLDTYLAGVWGQVMPSGRDLMRDGLSFSVTCQKMAVCPAFHDTRVEHLDKKVFPI